MYSFCFISIVADISTFFIFNLFDYFCFSSWSNISHQCNEREFHSNLKLSKFYWSPFGSYFFAYMSRWLLATCSTLVARRIRASHSETSSVRWADFALRPLFIVLWKFYFIGSMCSTAFAVSGQAVLQYVASAWMTGNQPGLHLYFAVELNRQINRFPLIFVLPFKLDY